MNVMHKYRWKRIKWKNNAAAEQFLLDRERDCVAACARFIHMETKEGLRAKVPILKKNSGHVWALQDDAGGSLSESGHSPSIKALLLHYGRSLFPVLNGKTSIPLPRFLNRFLGKVPVHAVQGLRADAEILTGAMEKLGYYAAEQIDYDLMALDKQPISSCYRYGPSGLLLRPAIPADIDELFRLQAAYEQEEVLPTGAEFNPAACRANLEQLMKTEQMLIACLGGRIAGKVNTSASSFTRRQIGGVYVHPDFRGMGIAVRMTAVFLKGIIEEGRGITLFVKKHNSAARAVYHRVGLTVQGEYRISYY